VRAGGVEQTIETEEEERPWVERSSRFHTATVCRWLRSSP
jgi:hypothetical protein